MPSKRTDGPTVEGSASCMSRLPAAIRKRRLYRGLSRELICFMAGPAYPTPKGSGTALQAQHAPHGREAASVRRARTVGVQHGQVQAGPITLMLIEGIGGIGIVQDQAIGIAGRLGQDRGSRYRFHQGVAAYDCF